MLFGYVRFVVSVTQRRSGRWPGGSVERFARESRAPLVARPRVWRAAKLRPRLRSGGGGGSESERASERKQIAYHMNISHNRCCSLSANAPTDRQPGPDGWQRRARRQTGAQSLLD